MRAQPILGALIGQLLGRPNAAASAITERRRARLERILVILLEHGNAPRPTLAKLAESSPRTIGDDMAELGATGMATTWTVARGSAVIRWYGLTQAGVVRARELRSMECSHA